MENIMNKYKLLLGMMLGFLLTSTTTFAKDLKIEGVKGEARDKGYYLKTEGVDGEARDKVKQEVDDTTIYGKVHMDVRETEVNKDEKDLGSGLKAIYKY
jgi:hypothetical protein